MANLPEKDSKPCRSSLDLKSEKNTWDDAFTLYDFSPHQLILMKNSNLRYKCLDGQDDFHAQMRNGNVNMPSWVDQGTAIFQDLDQIAIEDAINGDIGCTELDDFSLSMQLGRRNKAKINLMADIRHTLTTMGWTDHQSKLLSESLNITPDPISALRSSPVRFLHFFAGPRPVWSLKFPEPKKTGPEPVKTGSNRFGTCPGINVLKHSLNQNILQMFVKIDCRPLFYVYFKPLTIQISCELNIFRRFWKFDVQIFISRPFFIRFG